MSLRKLKQKREKSNYESISNNIVKDQSEIGGTDRPVKLQNKNYLTSRAFKQVFKNKFEKKNSSSKGDHRLLKRPAKSVLKQHNMELPKIMS
jgi:hypothetical protein